MNANGTPDFGFNEVDVTRDEYENGVHIDLVEERLFAAGYEGPFVHFADREAPHFLHAAVRHYLGLSRRGATLNHAKRKEKNRCPA
jgi:hypothetical protein